MTISVIEGLRPWGGITTNRVQPNLFSTLVVWHDIVFFYV